MNPAPAGEREEQKMKKRGIAFILAAALIFGLLGGCGQRGQTEEVTEGETVPSSQEAAESPSPADEREEVRIGSLKGPTSMGLVSLMEQNENQEAGQAYAFTMVTAADELLAQMVSGQLDIAMVPANVASVLYNRMKDQGGIRVININTLGVLYMVSSDTSIQSIGDLKGKTIYLTGKGQTPDYTLQYLLAQNGLSTEDVTLEYKSEATEVAAVLQETEGAVGLLPQPFVTVATTQNENVQIVLDMTEEWNKVQGEGGSQLVTGVTIVRNDFLKDREASVKAFLEEYQASTEFTNDNVEEAAELIAKLGIVEKAAVAQKAIPYCNITYIDGEEMRTALEGYLQVLFDQSPESVGGAMPEDDFYWLGN